VTENWGWNGQCQSTDCRWTFQGYSQATGERLSQAGWLSSSGSDHRVLNRGRIHQFLWRCSRIVSKREKGTERQGTIRSCSEPSLVTQVGFVPEWIAVTRGNGCYCVSARSDDSGGFRNEISQMKGAERRDKVSVWTGKDPGPRQGLWKPSGKSAIIKTLPLTCEWNATWELRGETRGTGQTHCHKRWLIRR